MAALGGWQGANHLICAAIAPLKFRKNRVINNKFVKIPSNVNCSVFFMPTYLVMIVNDFASNGDGGARIHSMLYQSLKAAIDFADSLLEDVTVDHAEVWQLTDSVLSLVYEN